MVTTHKFDRLRGVPAPGLERHDVSSSHILLMWRSGTSITNIAKFYKVAKSTVCYRLKKKYPDEYRKGRKNPTQAQKYAARARAYKLRQEGNSFKEIAELMGSAKSTAVERVKWMEGVVGTTFRFDNEGRILK